MLIQYSSDAADSQKSLENRTYRIDSEITYINVMTFHKVNKFRILNIQQYNGLD